MKMTLLRTLFWVMVPLLFSSCGGGGGGGDGGGTSVTPEQAMCSTNQTFSPATTVSGTAVYYYRPTHASTHILSGNPVSDTIAGAEVVVKDAAGNVVQCSNVDSSGNISLTLPRSAASYTVSVNSRASNSLLKASVLSDINSNVYYSISKSITLDGSSATHNLGQITAYARQSESSAMEGAAFNILKKIYQANAYIRTQISQSSWVAEKVTVYWKAGFNPYSYYGFANSPLSFYVSGERKLYILGGLNGDVKTSDTDHFDNSVILHEYGHFLEDVYSKSDSPGGSHNGNSITDPRLAWSEGWGNFIQAAVQGTNYYSDSSGFCNDTVESSGASCALNIYFTMDGSGATATMDSVSVNGEGVYREISATRTLYKTIASPISTTTSSLRAAIPFSEIWNVFSGTGTGFASSSVRFRNAGKFVQLLDTVVNTSTYSANQAAWNAIITNEKQAINSKYYADPVTAMASGSCVDGSSNPKFPIALSPVQDYSASCSGCIKTANKFHSNDFYEYYYNGTSNVQISISYTQSGVQTIDLDLIIYKSNYTYFEENSEANGGTNSTVATRSVRTNPAIESGSESVSMAGLPAGFYIINVKAATYNKSSAQLNGTANYTINESVSGGVLCPTN